VSDIEIVFSAVGLGDAPVSRWIALNRAVLAMDNVSASVVTDGITQYPGINVVSVTQTESFDLGTYSNCGIRQSTADIVVKTDADIVFSTRLIEYLAQAVIPGVCVIAKCTNIMVNDELGYDEQEEFCRLYQDSWGCHPVRPAGRGACFAMHRTDWALLRGYDERLRQYGADDDLMFARAQKLLEVVQTARNPLWHVDHTKRTGNDRFANLGAQNLSDAKLRPDWATMPESSRWGLGKQDIGEILAGASDIDITK